jgi:nitrogen fixation NifU-like protein
MVMEALYKAILLDHYRNPRHNTPLKNASITWTKSNPLCGDSVVVQLTIVNASLIDCISICAKGCVISVAAGSLLAEVILGKTLDYLRQYDIHQVPDLLGMSIGYTRLKCATLALDALKDSIAEYGIIQK